MKLLPILFKTSSCNNSPIPENNKFVLGISSLWILTLIRHSPLLLFTNIFLISVISPIFWFKYELNSISHKLDKFFVWTIFLLNLKLALYKLYIITSISLFSLIIFFYYLSEVFTIKKQFNYQLISHLLFRYFFFIWIYLTLFNNYSKLHLITMGYMSHNYYLTKYIHNYDIYNYIYYSFQLLFIVCFYI